MNIPKILPKRADVIIWSCNASAMKFYESCGLKPQKVHMETIFDKS